MIKLDLLFRDNGTYTIYVSNEDGTDCFYMQFTSNDLKENSPEVFLIKMASHIQSLYNQRGKKFTWKLE